MFASILVTMMIVGVFIGVGFVIMAILNVREHIAKNRRITREFKNQQQWERFSSRETK